MGTPYKIESEITDFILETKKINPNLSCRTVSDLIWEKFQKKVSKSSVNSILKNSGLSLSVGRRKKRPLENLADRQIEKYIEKPLEIIPLKQPAIIPAKEPLAKEKPVLSSVDKPVEKHQEITPVESKEESPAEPIAEKPPESIQEEKPPEPPKQPMQEGPAEKSEPSEINSVQEIRPAEQKEEKTTEPSAEKPPEPTHEEKIAESIPEKRAESIQEEPAKKPELSTTNPAIYEQAELFIDTECCGAILLKAADCLSGGTHYITETIKNKLRCQSTDLLTKTERLLFSQLNPDFNVGLFADKILTAEDISLYSAKLQSVTNLPSDIFEIISSMLQEVHYLTVALSDNTVFYYLDAQVYTIWSTPNIPDDFSLPTYKIKNCIKNCFREDAPLVLFTAPGYDTPPEEFFNFILTQTESSAKISRLTTFNNRNEQLEGIGIDRNKKQSFVFGLWPWQFTEYRKVKRLGKFTPLFFEALKKNLYAAEIVLELSQPYSADVTVTLRGCVLKNSPDEKIRIVILSNLSVEPEELADIYLTRWPNLEETFKDYSRKIELFTYTANSQRSFSGESQNLSKKREFTTDINTLFSYYLKLLDLYVKWRFLPPGYEDMDFSQMNQFFYNLKVGVKKDKNSVIATFQIPPAHPHLKALEYACQRINEREIILKNGKRLWVLI